MPLPTGRQTTTRNYHPAERYGYLDFPTEGNVATGDGVPNYTPDNKESRVYQDNITGDMYVHNGTSWGLLGSSVVVDYDHETVVVTSQAQTTFTLLGTVTEPEESTLILDGFAFSYGKDYTILGNTLTILLTSFELEPGEQLSLTYRVS